jgi:hypothetical protein
LLEFTGEARAGDIAATHGTAGATLNCMRVVKSVQKDVSNTTRTFALGDLIAALVDQAGRVTDDRNVTSRIAADALSDLLAHTGHADVARRLAEQLS